MRPFSAGHLRGYDVDAVPVARCEMIVAMDVVGDAKDGSQMRGVNVVYYVTLLALAAGLTALLGYEIGWLAARSKVSLVAAGTMVPWAVFVAWAVSDV